MRNVIAGKNFVRLATDMNIDKAMAEVQAKLHLYDLITFRQDFEQSPHSMTRSIICRIAEDPDFINAAMSNLECVDTEEYLELPEVYNQVMTLMSIVQGERIGRVLVVELAPGGKIDAHCDEGDYHKYYDRFHIVLGSAPVHFRVENDYVTMSKGDIWWFANHKEHEVWNDSAETRHSIIVDIKLRGDKI